MAVRGLRELARLYGVQTAYYDITGQRQHASPEALLLTLRALGAPLETLADVPCALRERRRALWYRGLEPVAVAWGGRRHALTLRQPRGSADVVVRCPLAL